MNTVGKHHNRGGKLIITRQGNNFYKYRTRLQIMPDGKRVLHYDPVKPKLS